MTLRWSSSIISLSVSLPIFTGNSVNSNFFFYLLSEVLRRVISSFITMLYLWLLRFLYSFAWSVPLKLHYLTRAIYFLTYHRIIDRTKCIKTLKWILQKQMKIKLNNTKNKTANNKSAIHLIIKVNRISKTHKPLSNQNIWICANGNSYSN